MYGLAPRLCEFCNREPIARKLRLTPFETADVCQRCHDLAFEQVEPLHQPEIEKLAASIAPERLNG